MGSLLNIDEMYQEVQRNESLTVCKNGREIDRAIEEGKIAIVLSMEGARPLKGRPGLNGSSLLRVFYRLGLRALQLVDNGRN